MNTTVLKMYSLYRPKSKDWKWSPPFYGLNDTQVIATFLEMSKTQPELSKSYIYHIGLFDVATGIYKKIKTPTLVKVPKVKKAKKDEK